MSLFLPFLHDDHHHVVSSLLGGADQDVALRYKLAGDDLLGPLIPRRARRQITSCPYTRHLSHNKKTSLATTNNKNFEVNLDVQQFSPEDISVKSVGDESIVVECKHEEKKDEHGYITRHFVRKYKVPKGHDVSRSVSKLSSDGVLTITVPNVEKNEKTEVDIPITFTNQPSQIQNAASKEVVNGEASKEVKDVKK